MLKVLFTLTVFFSYFVSNAQNSYEFKTAVPPESETVKTIESKFYGEYINEKTGTKYIINSEGFSMVTTIISFVTKEQVRESSKLDVRNDFLFGVVDNDSVPCVLEEDKYYFGIKQKTILNDSKNKAIIKKINDQSYMINFVESKGYSPSIIQFKNNSLAISHFTYPSETNVFDKISKSDKSLEKNYTLILLNPSLKEWNALDKKIIFDTEIVYLKQ